MMVTSGKDADKTPQETKGIPCTVRKCVQALARSSSNHVIHNDKSISALV